MVCAYKRKGVIFNSNAWINTSEEMINKYYNEFCQKKKKNEIMFDIVILTK
jgi:hypothetical protein